MTKTRKIAGVDVLLEVQNERGEYVVVGGQTGASLSREREEIDTTDKTTGGWSSAIPGLASWSVEGEGFVQLNDNTFDLVEDAFMEGKEVRVKLRVGENHNESGRTYSGYGYILDLPLDFAQDAAVTFSLTIRGNGKLEILKGATGEAPPVEPVKQLKMTIVEEPGDESYTNLVARVQGHSDSLHVSITNPDGTVTSGVDELYFAVYTNGTYHFTAYDAFSGEEVQKSISVVSFAE